MPHNGQLSQLKIKIFRTVREHYAIVGISPTILLPNQHLPFDERVLLGFLSFVCTTVSQVVYLLHIASHFMEYVECACSLSGTIIIFVCFMSIVFRKTTLFDSIDDIEKLIDSSKSFWCSTQWFSIRIWMYWISVHKLKTNVYCFRM